MGDRQNDRPDSAAALAELLTATARGDRAAFQQLYRATSGKLYGTAVRILRRRDLADDVVQEAYIRIWRHAERFDPARGSPVTWMATIVRHLAIDLARRNRDAHTGGEAELLALASDRPDPFDDLAMTERHRRVREVLDRLDPVKRRLIIAAYLHGESREQLAARFGAPVNTIKTWLRRAILEMRAAIDGDRGRWLA
jgi:RNA polymerase sigma-70 factor (ECF subfamily)